MNAKTKLLEHIELYPEYPEKAHYVDFGDGKLRPTLLLTTIGRKSGNPVHAPVLYDKTGDSFVVQGAMLGSPKHPSWYLNLVANPQTEIQAGPVHHRVTARTATGSEREKLWAQMVELYPPLTDNQKQTAGREIPVVVLEAVK